MNDGKHFENRTASIIKQLHPGADVLQNVRLDGRLSEFKKREVDIQLIKPGKYDFLAFECKDKTRNIDVPVVEAFYTKCLDIGAKQRAIVSNSSYSKGAVNMASKLNIGLLHLIDTEDLAIRSLLRVPAFLEDTYCKTFSVTFKTSDKATFQNPLDPTNLVLLDSSDNEITAYTVFSNLWNQGGILKDEPGRYIYSPIQNNMRALDINNKLIHLKELNFRYEVINRYFAGLLDITESQGLYDVRNKTYQTRGFSLQSIEPAALEKEWEEITDPVIAKKEKLFGLGMKSLFPENYLDL